MVPVYHKIAIKNRSAKFNCHSVYSYCTVYIIPKSKFDCSHHWFSNFKLKLMAQAHL